MSSPLAVHTTPLESQKTSSGANASGSRTSHLIPSSSASSLSSATPNTRSNDTPSSLQSSSSHGSTLHSATAPNSTQAPEKSSSSSLSAPTHKQVRSSLKVKSRDIVKPSPAVYESTDGPLIRVTLKHALELFQSKITEVSQSSDTLLFIEQVMITHLYWTTTADLLKCFTNAIHKAKSDHGGDDIMLSRTCLKVCQTLKTFLTYFDVSTQSIPLSELQAAINIAHPQLNDALSKWIGNNASAFAKSSNIFSAAPISGLVPIGMPNHSLSVSASGSTRSSGSNSPPPQRPHDTLAGSDSDQSSNGQRSPVHSRSHTPGKHADGRHRPGSGTIDRDLITHSTPIRDGAASPSARKLTSRPSGSSVSSDNPFASSGTGISSASVGPSGSSISLTSAELPEPETLASQMALADWTVFSKCLIIDFMNASYLPKNKPSAPSPTPSGASGESEKTSAAAPASGTNTTPPPNFNSVARYIEHTNMTTRWIATKILGGASPRSRGKLLSYFVRLMELLKERGDYTGMINVFTTLNTNSIWKLRKSWKYVDTKRSKAFAKFEAIIKPMANFAGYRDLLGKSSPPSVPALAILTKDLVAIEEQPTYVEDEEGNPTRYLNWIKFAQLSAVISEQFLRFAKSGYGVAPIPGLFEELINPESIEIKSPRDIRDAATTTLAPGTIIPFLLSEGEISETADIIDMEEQGLASPINTRDPVPTAQQSTPASAPAPMLGSGGKRPSALSLYLQFASIPIATSPTLQRSTSPPPSQLSATVTALREKMIQTSSVPSDGSFLSITDSLDHVASVIILRRVLTNALFTTHLVSESLTDQQRKSFENQHVLAQRDSIVRMLKLADISVEKANLVATSRWRSVSDSPAPRVKNSERSGSLPSIVESKSLYMEAHPGDTLKGIEDLELVNPHTHLMEVLAETVRLFQKFDGATKFRNMIRLNQLVSASGIGQSLLLENRGVLAEMSIGSRTIINAFIASAAYYFTTIAPNLGSMPVNVNNICFGCATQIDRVSINLQISITNNEAFLPKGLLPLPSVDMGISNKTTVPKLLSQLPAPLAELLLPFESIISHTASSVAWYSKVTEQVPTTGKKDKNSSPPVTSRSVPGDDDAFITYSAGASSQEGVMVLSIVLPLGSYASTLSCVSPSQKRYLASKLTAIFVNQWKVEHVVTWLYLSGMSAWCTKFEQQSISGSELSDLDSSDLDDMHVHPPMSQSSGQLLKLIKVLVKSSVWDGAISETPTPLSELSFNLPGYLVNSSSSGSLYEHNEDTSDDSEDIVPHHEQELSESSGTDDMFGTLSAKLRRRVKADDNLTRSGSPSGSRKNLFSTPRDAANSANFIAAPLPDGRKKRRNSSARASPASSPPLGSPISASSLGLSGASSPSHRRHSRASIARLRVLEGMRSGIITFTDPSEFTLSNFLAKVTALFKPATSYGEEAEIVYYDLTGEMLNIGGSLSFNRLSDGVWHELITDGSIDTVYAAINPPQDSMPSPTAITLSANSPGINSGLKEAAASPSVSPPFTPPTVIDYPTKYQKENDTVPVLVLEESSGSILWFTEVCKKTIANEAFVGRNLDHFTPESMFDLMKKIKADPSAKTVTTVVAGDTGILNATLRLSPLAGTSPAAWECIISIDETFDGAFVELPKLRDAGGKCNAKVLCYSLQYGLIQFANRNMLQALGFDTLQGTKIANVMPFGSPTTPGLHSSIPFQKKDGSLAVGNCVLRSYPSGSDSIIVLSSTL